MDKAKIKTGIQKYTMIIVLVLVTLFFTWGTQGKILLPQNITNLISQNAYVFVLATGMLLCILTGGNIDLSVGSVVCFVGAVGGVLMETMQVPVGRRSCADAFARRADRRMAGVLDRFPAYPAVHHDAVRHACIPRSLKYCTGR